MAARKPTDKTLGESLRERGVSRRGFLKFCAATASMMALPPSMAPAIAAALETAAPVLSTDLDIAPPHRPAVPMPLPPDDPDATP